MHNSPAEQLFKAPGIDDANEKIGNLAAVYGVIAVNIQGIIGFIVKLDGPEVGAYPSLSWNPQISHDLVENSQGVAFQFRIEEFICTQVMKVADDEPVDSEDEK